MAKKEYIKVNKKTLWVIAAAVAVLSVLLSRHEPGSAILFVLGVGTGVLIGVFSRE